MTSQPLVAECASRLGVLNSRSSSVSSRSVAPATATTTRRRRRTSTRSPAWEKSKGWRNDGPGEADAGNHRKTMENQYKRHRKWVDFLFWFSSSSAKHAWAEIPFNMRPCWDGYDILILYWYTPNQVKHFPNLAWIWTDRMNLSLQNDLLRSYGLAILVIVVNHPILDVVTTLPPQPNAECADTRIYVKGRVVPAHLMVTSIAQTPAEAVSVKLAFRHGAAQYRNMKVWVNIKKLSIFETYH